MGQTNLFGIFACNTTLFQNLKNVALLEQKIDRGDENISLTPEEPKKAQVE